MAQSTSASAGPNAASSVAVAVRDNGGQSSTTIHLNIDEIFSSVTVPPPLLPRWPEYPPAPPMCPDDPGHYRTATTVNSNKRNSAIALELTIQFDHPTVSSSTGDPSSSPSPTAMKNKTHGGGLCTICRSKTHTFYRPQIPLHKVIEQAPPPPPLAAATSDGSSHNASSPIPTHLLPYVTLYDAQKQAIWSLTARTRHALEFVAQQQQQQYRVSLLTATLSFQWINGQMYQWRLVPSNTSTSYDLRCYYQDSILVAEFVVGNRYIAWSHTPAENKTNPFRQSPLPGAAAAAAAAATNDSSNNDSNSSSNSSGNSSSSDNHGDLLNAFLLLTGLLLLDNLGSTTAMATRVDMEDEDDTVSMGSSMYYADQGLVDAAPTVGRWYSGSGSVRSIELDPGLLHCWWGIGFCWSWCPCCMPGGWCDRFRWSLLRRKRDDRHASTISRSRQRPPRGWQQHHPDQH